MPTALPSLSLLVAALVPGAGTDPQEGALLERGDVLCVLGNALAERLQHDGWLEVELAAHRPELELRVRHLGFGGDEVGVHQRTHNFGKFAADGMELDLPEEPFVPWDRYLAHCGADLVLACFGFNESFAGEAGRPAFRERLEAFVDHVEGRRYGEEPARLVLASSIPFEDTGSEHLPASGAANERIAAYNDVIRAVAAARGVPFVDLFGPMAAHYAAESEPLTLNGIHLNERGHRLLAAVLRRALLPDTPAAPLERAHTLDALREAVRAKNLLWFNRYRATDGYNVYGGRSRQVYAAAEDGERFSNFEVLQREMDLLDALVARRDREIHALARGEDVAVNAADGGAVPELLAVRTNRRGDGPDGAHRFLEGEDALATLTPAPGFVVELFASEEDFPELANPVQMSFDTRGRLWVAVWPSYTHWRPDQPMRDKLLVLEDADGDGRADRCTAFADDLHNPTGFELWNGGVLLASVPDLLFLEDTDGDGVADRRERLLHGLSSADTHHAANSFVLGPDGALYFQEGTFHRSQIETPYGPVRNRNACLWRFDPRSFRVERYVAYDFANPHGHVFDRWGQDFVTDGTGNENYYALPFSGHLPEPRKHRPYFTFFRQRSRPAAATEILSSQAFPAASQGNYLIANVIGFQGIFQYRVRDDGSGFAAEEVEPLVTSDDPNFRPVDIEVGPDGAVYLLDWHNPLIGHLQHHIRDPSRDTSHGRIFRVRPKGVALATPEPIAGRPIAELLERLRSPEDRLRYRVRIELSARDSDAVCAAARAWERALDPEDADVEHHRLEALWLQQQHGRLDRGLLARLLRARDARARAAAVRALRHGRHHFADPREALELLASAAHDEHPRVRLEAVVAASHFDDPRAVALALEALQRPTDRFLDYALEETLRALEPRWGEALRDAEWLAGNPAGAAHLLARVERDELLELPRTPAVLEALLVRHGVERSERDRAAQELAQLAGGAPGVHLLAAVRRVDASRGAHAEHVLRELGALVLERSNRGEPALRSALDALAESAQRPITRGLAWAARLEREGAGEDLLGEAARTSESLGAWIAGVGLVRDAQRRASLFEPLLGIAAGATTQASNGPAGSGLEVGFFEPAPPDARRASFRHAPDERVDAPAITLDLAPARVSDSFGLLFRGTLHVPVAGRYTFWTTSDDGSRLYLGERCVVENDGAHSMLTASGSLELAAGAHPLLVTYFERGGGEGLLVEWAGPGREREPIPAEVLGRPGPAHLRGPAMRALAGIDGHAEAKLRSARAWLAEGPWLAPVLDLVRSVPAAERSAERVRPLVQALADAVERRPTLERLEAQPAAALALARELVGALPEEERAGHLARLDELGGTSIVIRTLPHEMRFDLEELWVEAGQPVTLVFENDDLMPHNLVVALPGALRAVGEAAERLDGARAAEHQYVPEDGRVLWSTRLLLPGESQRLSFIAPQEAADHPYLCTYPGHWRVMNGVLHVVEDLTAAPALVRRTAGTAPVAPRPFVRDWTLEELAPRFTADWEGGRSTAKGRELFDALGCARCHAVDGEASLGGPDLAEAASKRRGAELLAHLLDPSLEVLEDYRLQGFELVDGTVLHGRVVAQDDAELALVEALLEPERVTRIEREEIAERWDTGLSPMPTGLLVTCTEPEILDLLAYVQSVQDTPATAPGAQPWVVYEGGEGPGVGHHIVLVSGDDEYRSEEALPMLGRLLAERHGFRCTVLFAIDPESGAIRPDAQTNLPGLHHLDDADLMVCFLRFRQVPDADMAHFVDFVESGKPILGIRTATHAFHYRDETPSPYRPYDWRSTEWPGGFGRQILGETWVRHHGKHGVQSTRGVIEPANAEHPVLRGVADVWGPTDVYYVDPARLDQPDTRILLRGAVLEGMRPEDPPVAGEPNEPMIPIAWARELARADGSRQRVVCSTIGSSQDLLSADLRRMFVNACYWGLGLEDRIDPASPVEPVGPYEPTPFGFGTYTVGVRPEDHAAR